MPVELDTKENKIYLIYPFILPRGEVSFICNILEELTMEEKKIRRMEKKINNLSIENKELGQEIFELRQEIENLRISAVL